MLCISYLRAEGIDEGSLITGDWL
jgi:hypothetical protein